MQICKNQKTAKMKLRQLLRQATIFIAFFSFLLYFDLGLQFVTIMKCIVKCCEKSNTKNCRNTSFHRFPKNEELRKKWLVLLNLGIGYPLKDADAVCGDHFEPHVFVKKLIRGKWKVFLKPESLPKACFEQIFDGQAPNKELSVMPDPRMESTDEDSSSALSPKMEVLDEDPLAAITPEMEIFDESSAIPPINHVDPRMYQKQTLQNIRLKSRVEELINKNKILQRKVNRLTKKNEKLEADIKVLKQEKFSSK